MEHLTVEDLTPEELKHYDERLGHLLDEGYPEATAISICLDGIKVKRELSK